MTSVKDTGTGRGKQRSDRKRAKNVKNSIPVAYVLTFSVKWGGWDTKKLRCYRKHYRKGKREPNLSFLLGPRSH